MAKDRRDHGYAWIILLASIFCNILYSTVLLCYSLFIVNFMDAFDIQTYQAGWIVSINSFFSATGGIAGGVLIEKFSCRSVGFYGALLGSLALVVSSQAYSLLLFITFFSFISGIGISLTRLPPVVIIQMYFEEKRPFATGLSLIGYSLGVFAGLPIVAYCIDYFGWRGALMIVSGLCLNMCILMLMFSPLKQENDSIEKQYTTEKKNYSSFSLLKDPLFLLCAFSYMLFQFGADIMFKVSVPRAELDLGVSKMLACGIVSAVSIGGFVSRVMSSVISNLSCVNITAMYAFSILTGGAVIVLSAFIHSYIFNIIIGGIYGLMFGMATSVQTTVLVNLLGVEKIAQSNGLVVGMVGVMYLVVLPFAGWIYDTFESFSISYFIAGLVQCLGGIIALILLCVSRRKETLDIDITEIDRTPEKFIGSLVLNSGSLCSIHSKNSSVISPIGSSILIPSGSTGNIAHKEHLLAKHYDHLTLNTSSTPNIHRKGQLYNKHLESLKMESGSTTSMHSKSSLPGRHLINMNTGPGLMGSIQNLNTSNSRLSHVALGSIQSLSTIK